MGIEAINKVAELASEVGKAQLILESKDNQIEQMQEFIDNQTKQINEMSNQLDVYQRNADKHRQQEMERMMSPEQKAGDPAKHQTGLPND